jgi:hypothetical protein
MLAAAAAGPLDELDQARVDLLQAELAFAQNRGSDAPLLLLQAARKLETLDLRLSRNTYLEAWGAALFAGRLASASLLDVSAAVATAPKPADPPLPCDLLLDGFALVFTAGRPAATPVLRRAVAAFASTEVSVEEVLRWGWLANRAAIFIWDYDGCLEVGTRAVQLARESGALEALAVVDNALGQAAAFGGDFATAALLIAEVAAVKEATGTRIAPHAALALAGIRGHEAETAELLERELGRFPVLRERQAQLAGTLSGGEQQMLAISRGLMARPKLLLLDEPSMGLAPLLVKQVAETVKQLNTEGVTILLVEQMAMMALSVAHRAYVIQNGTVRIEGPSAGLARNPEVVRAYLGGGARHE